MRLVAILLFACLAWASVPQAQPPRVIYLATVQGDGSDENPFRSTGWGAVANQGCIDLRPDPTVATGRMLCAADTLPAGGGINQLGGFLADTLTPVRRAVLQAVIGESISSSTLTDVIAEILISKARLDGTRWKPLRAGKDGKYHIWLGERQEAWTQTAWLYPYINDGGLVADASNAALSVIEPTLAWAASIAEDFNCANSASLTCDLTWTEFFGTEWEISANQARVTGLTGTVQKEARSDSALAGDAHWAQATLVELTADNSGTTRCGPIARKDNSSTRTFYSFVGSMNNSLYIDYETRKRVGGTLTAIATDTTDPVAGEVMRIYVDGSSISGYVNGVLRVGPTTDTSITGNTYAGMAYSSNNPTTQSCILDDFSAQDIVASSGNGPIRRRG